ncbi:MAG: hypothetical protein KF836_14105 [Fimbriimonadaceae bacterium]|nr:hypothetical protein [Fimbriimonadaceae bacterium]
MQRKEKMNMLYMAAIYLVAFLLATGCATQNKSAGLGGLIGATGGAALGGIADPGKNGEYRTRNVVVGATIGGMAGLVAGSALHEEIKSREAKAYANGRASAPRQATGAMPSLREAKVESRWIEGRVVGNRYIEGHFEYVIIEPTRWDGQ